MRADYCTVARTLPSATLRGITRALHATPRRELPDLDARALLGGPQKTFLLGRRAASHCGSGRHVFGLRGSFSPRLGLPLFHRREGLADFLRVYFSAGHRTARAGSNSVSNLGLATLDMHAELPRTQADSDSPTARGKTRRNKPTLKLTRAAGGALGEAGL